MFWFWLLNFRLSEWLKKKVVGWYLANPGSSSCNYFRKGIPRTKLKAANEPLIGSIQVIQTHIRSWSLSIRNIQLEPRKAKVLKSNLNKSIWCDCWWRFNPAMVTINIKNLNNLLRFVLYPTFFISFIPPIPNNWSDQMTMKGRSFIKTYCLHMVTRFVVCEHWKATFPPPDEKTCKTTKTDSSLEAI